MDVILDTNQILSDPKMERNYFTELFTYLRRTGSILIVPTIVFREASARYSAELTRRFQAAVSACGNLKHFCVETRHFVPTINLPAELRAFKRRLFNPAPGVKVIAYRKMGAAHIREVLRRGVHRIRPASASGEELRDVALWLVALQYAKETGRPVAFITSDSDFASAEKDGLHPDLVSECEQKGVEIRFYRELRDFVVANALAQEAIDEAELLKYIPLDRAHEAASRLLSLRLAEKGAVQRCTITKLSFVSGQKYAVGEDSYFIETSVTGEANVSILENSLSWFVRQSNILSARASTDALFGVDPLALGTFSNLFSSGIPLASEKWPSLGSLRFATQPVSASSFLVTSSGNAIQSAELGQPTIEKVYRCGFTLRLSARVVKDKLEALEPEGIRMEELRVAEPERTAPPGRVASEPETGSVTATKMPHKRAHVPRKRR